MGSGFLDTYLALASLTNGFTDEKSEFIDSHWCDAVARAR
jgi:hypothetical protein